MSPGRTLPPRVFRYPTPSEVILICLYLIDRYYQTTRGERRELLDPAMLEAALNAPRATFDGQELFPTMPAKVSCLFRSLVKNHPFFDGNKRTAVVTSVAFLEMNGYSLAVKKGEIYDLALMVAESRDNDAIMAHLNKWFGRRITWAPD